MREILKADALAKLKSQCPTLFAMGWFKVRIFVIWYPFSGNPLQPGKPSKRRERNRERGRRTKKRSVDKGTRDDKW